MCSSVGLLNTVIVILFDLCHLNHTSRSKSTIASFVLMFENAIWQLVKVCLWGAFPDDSESVVTLTAFPAKKPAFHFYCWWLLNFIQSMIWVNDIKLERLIWNLLQVILVAFTCQICDDMNISKQWTVSASKWFQPFPCWL